MMILKYTLIIIPNRQIGKRARLKYIILSGMINIMHKRREYQGKFIDFILIQHETTITNNKTRAVDNF